MVNFVRGLINETEDEEFDSDTKKGNSKIL